MMPTSLKALCHWAEHPNTIRAVEDKVILPLGALGMGALTAKDAWQAPSDERKKVLIRDGLVLGATAVGTMVGARGLGASLAGRLMQPLERVGLNTAKGVGAGLKSFLQDGLMKYPETKGREELAEVIEHGAKFLKDNHYSKELQDLVEGMTDPKHGIFGAYKDILNKMEQEFKGKGLPESDWQKHLKAVFTEKPPEGFLDELGKAGQFFLVGGISVLSGLAGGLLANKINGVKDKNATTNMIKEGIFQFIANIALCAVGASLALAVVNGEWAPNMRGLAGVHNAGKRFGKWVAHHPYNKLIRTGIIGMGLSIGIFGGGHVANWLGRKYVNPFFDKLQGKTADPRLAGQPKKAEKRRIEFSDAILHLDDVPTAMALAGVEIVTPFIPLFFAFSGYRTGIGYRNDGSNQLGSKSTPQQPMAWPQQPTNFPGHWPMYAAPPMPRRGQAAQPAFARNDSAAHSWPSNGGGFQNAPWQQPLGQGTTQFRY